jgi:hypothetical protein
MSTGSHEESEAMLVAPMKPPSHHPDVPSDITSSDSEDECEETWPSPLFRPSLSGRAAPFPLKPVFDLFRSYDVTLPLRIMKCNRNGPKHKLLAAAPF